jgi:ribonuclease P protein component
MTSAGVTMLRTPAEFSRCLGQPAPYRDGAFALHVAFGSGDDASSSAPRTWRLGLVIPKRYEKSAVARNTIKRRWRAAFRQGHGTLSGEFGNADLVVRLQRPLLPKTTAVGVSAALKPAKRRARALFDPDAMLLSLAERLRVKRSRPARPAARPTLS